MAAPLHTQYDGGLEPRLEKARHIKYWSRCLKTFLPHQYTSNDSNRMYLGFFILAALDLLDGLTTAANAAERRDYARWIYHCQHPAGGFRMWPGTDLGERAHARNARWDPANIPGTYFALASLLILDDDFGRVNRRATLEWLCKMQRPDGSFGETLVDGRIEGGRDPRFAYCAAGIRFILRGVREGPLIVDHRELQDVDVDGLVRCVRASESFDGGIADEAFHEPHAGYTFCSLGALAFVGRLNSKSSTKDSLCAPADPQMVLKWLSARQTDLIDPEVELDTDSSDPSEPHQIPSIGNKQDSVDAAEPVHQSPDKSSAHPVLGRESTCWGMNGRLNKVADTCYAFWVSGSLHILGQPALCDQASLRNYLLAKTQHDVLGGFGKYPGDLPDLYHSYLGLAALSLVGDNQVKELDGGMCLSKSARAKLPALWEIWNKTSHDNG